MKIKALCSFSGIISMHKDQAREVDDAMAEDLIEAGYAEALDISEEPQDLREKSAKKKAGKKSANEEPGEDESAGEEPDEGEHAEESAAVEADGGGETNEAQ